MSRSPAPRADNRYGLVPVHVADQGRRRQHASAGVAAADVDSLRQPPVTLPELVRGRLSASERDRIEELAGKGTAAGRIAQLLNRLPATVAWFMYTHGLKAPKQTDTPKTYERYGKTVRGFSRAEDEYITELRIQGLAPREIARITNNRFGTERSTHTISGRLKMLGSIDDELAGDTTSGEA